MFGGHGKELSLVAIFVLGRIGIHRYKEYYGYTNSYENPERKTTTFADGLNFQLNSLRVKSADDL